MRYTDVGDTDCSIAQALSVVGDWWTLLLVRDLAGGTHQFDALHERLGISRKVLAVRLRALVEDGVVEKRLYLAHPPRYAYHLTRKGRALLPVLVALQDWGTHHLLGDGTLTATGTPGTAETRRVHALIGTRIPELALPVATASAHPRLADPVGPGPWTVLSCFPGVYAPDAPGRPPGWDLIPGASGCDPHACAYRDRLAEFTARGATVHGVSTQRPDQQAAFAAHRAIPFTLLSDTALHLAGALRLPTFRADGIDRLKRLTLLVDGSRTVREVWYPVVDPGGSVGEVLALIGAVG